MERYLTSNSGYRILPIARFVDDKRTEGAVVEFFSTSYNLALVMLKHEAEQLMEDIRNELSNKD